MCRFNAIFRSSSGLSGLTTAIVAAGLSLGLMPDEQQKMLEGRKALCESIAVQYSLAAQRNDLPMIQEATQTILGRNQDVLSAAVTRNDGQLLAELTDREPLNDAEGSSPSRVQLPIASRDQRWGTVDLVFRPLPAAGSWNPARNPSLRLILLVAAATFLVSFLFLHATTPREPARQNNSIPEGARAVFNMMAEGVLILDREQRIVLANEAFGRLSNQPAATLEGRLFAELPWRSPSGKSRPWAAAVEQGVIQKGIVLRLQSGGQRPRTVSLNITPAFSPNHSPQGSLVTVDDLSAIRRKNAQLRKLLAVTALAKKHLKRSEGALKVLNASLREEIEERKRAEEEVRKARDELEERVQERTRDLARVNEGLCAEIRERSRVEKELRESEKRFRKAIQEAPFPILIHAENGEILQTSRAFNHLTGYAAEELATVFSWTTRVLNAPQGSDPELTARVPDGECVVLTAARVRKTWDFSSAALGALPDGRQLTITMAMDVTERKENAEMRKRLLKQTLLAQENERRRLARELHDGVGQSLTSLLVRLRTLEDVKSLTEARVGAIELGGLTVSTLKEIRRMARGLRPSALDDFGLAVALERLVTDFSETHGVAVDLQISEDHLGRLPSLVETSLYRIIQEALANTVKHARAEIISVVVERWPEFVQAIIEDDGCGFESEGPQATTHFGLSSMRERAGLVGGSVLIESSPGSGTAVSVRIPIVEGPYGKDSDSDCR